MFVPDKFIVCESSVVTLERRYGPRRLRDDDDDESWYQWKTRIKAISY